MTNNGRLDRQGIDVQEEGKQWQAHADRAKANFEAVKEQRPVGINSHPDRQNRMIDTRNLRK
ncbi:hypothetical protein [Cohnella hashimotonis]|uniref:DUF2188 domain-containing protein n=1 Tax=Cohnella hashimotonis TaxID=2826895 RepID=A0ABT6TJU5_9BACL|nr:hypothetical protein [Cohnella hashimotonis]MDI4646122.1 hypothetical protein [Cohnella hashimotonis]